VPSKPRLLFSCGDPAGLGPRAVVLSLRRPAVRAACEPVVVGEEAVWRRAGWTPALAGLVDTKLGGLPAYGTPTAETGRLSFAALDRSLGLLRRRLADGLVTAPISKKAWDLAGVPYRDHTEWLSRETGRPRAQMILAAPKAGLWTVLVTRHVPLSRVSSQLTPAKVVDAARSLDEALRALRGRRPKLGLCGFNPHAGEDDLLGPEESRVLAPAAARARAAGLSLAGPVAADTAWRWHAAGRLDGLVALYHDQSLIGLKTAAGLSIVNWTTGLPFPRTSPGHGTGFDLAGRADPDPSATVEAALLCARLAARRR
jgi:4-hydroxythreonine-4-phosphate dehydrogenase